MDRFRSARLLIRRLEWLLVALLAGWLAWFCFRNGGFVVGSDMLYYLDVGLRRIADPFLLNRYTHVYALRIASVLMGSTLAGVRLYSAIAAGATVLLAFLIGRRLTADANLANGLLAISLTLSTPLLVQLLLGPSVDTMLMVIVLGFVALYMHTAGLPGDKRWKLVGLGVLFFFAIRTKEVAWVLIALLPSLGLEDDRFHWRALGRSLRYLVVGALAAALAMVAANGIFIGTPLFGWRPSDVADYAAIWSSTVRSRALEASTLGELLVSQNLVAFVLYMAAGLWFGRSLTKSTRAIWIIPLALGAFLLIGTTRTNWNIVPRGFLAGLAVMGAIGSRAVTVRWPPPARSLRWVVLASTIALGLAAFGLLTRQTASLGTYFKFAFTPAVLVLMLALMFMSSDRPQHGWALFVLAIGLTAAAVGFNLRSIPASLERTGWRSRFDLPLAFEDRMEFNSPEAAYFSRDLLAGLPAVSNRDELAALVNVGLDVQTIRSNYLIGAVDEALVELLEHGEQRYVVVTSSEWDWLRTAPQDRPAWRQRYETFEESTGRFVLLSLKSD